MKIGKNFGNWGSVEHYRDDIVTIGDNVVLGEGSVIVTHCPISFYTGKPIYIKIGNNVYIGKRCFILPGTIIGDNVVIGAGSVVASDLPSDVVAAGNPCRVIRDITKKESQRLKLLSEQGLVADGKEPDWSKNEDRQ